jgi:hypothetical protein
MGIAIRQANLAAEEEKLVEILDRNLPDRPNRKIHKKRHTNPLGPGWSWIAYLPETDTTVGTASSFPRRFRVDGKKILCAQVVDFAIELPYRSLGPAVLLQKATFAPAVSGEVAFCYDCPPHDRGMSTFARLGMTPLCEVFRYAFLLRSDEFMTKRLGTAPWTKPLIATTNAMLAMRRSRPLDQGVEVQEQPLSFNEEFSLLDETTPSSGEVRGSRTADDLNWRYQDDCSEGSSASGVERCRVLGARRAGELVGFAVLHVQTNGVACISDFFGRDLSEYGGPLMEAIIDVCRKEELTRIDAFSSSGCALASLLQKTGFRPRQRIFSVVPYQNGNGFADMVHGNRSWPFGCFEVSA